jgi:hypothetical protein
MTKDVDTLGGTLTINPNYDLESSQGDVALGYSMDNTSIRIDAQKKRLTVAHVFLDDNEIIPSISANGDFSLSYSRTLDTGKITTMWTPNDSIKVTWTDGEWETSFQAPMDGFYKINQTVKVNMKRSASLM